MKARLITLVITFLFLVAIPLTVSAAPAFVNLSMDRTTISTGESVTFSIRATSQTSHVFANVDGARVSGTRISGNEWSVTVSPSRTTVVSVFANNSNSENNAAVMNVPITVSGSGSTTNNNTTTNVDARVPEPPANLGPLDIASITETRATAQGFVQLTVVTGSQVNDVWVNFDRVNNTRATGRFARASMLTQGANSRTWVINFDPERWAAQTVEVGANRSYTWPGATTEVFNVTLSQPFVVPTTPRINSVSPSPRRVSSNGSTTFTIVTNSEAEHVWVRDTDGREYTATRTTSTSTTQTWTVRFSPNRTGTVRVFANITRTETGAATRNESITVGNTSSNNNWDDDWGNGDAQIIGTPSATVIGGDTVRIRVTTNSSTEAVWATMPSSNHRISLHRVNSGSGNRQWEAEVWDDSTSGNILISVSSVRGNVNNLRHDDQRSIQRSWNNNNNWWDDDNWGDGRIHSASLWSGQSSSVRRGHEVDFTVFTSTNITALDVNSGHVQVIDFRERGNPSGNQQEWILTLRIRDSAPNTLNLTLEAYIGGSRVDTRSLPRLDVRD